MGRVPYLPPARGPQLVFDGDLTKIVVYVLGRDIPVGQIVPHCGRWFGQISLYGQRVSLIADTPQAIVNEFEEWVAKGMPRRSKLLRPDRATRRASARIYIKAMLSGREAKGHGGSSH
jgi:hypothetical protein